MPDRRLQVFHAVAKQMSFTKAAEVLFMTQPAVPFQIKQLEEFYNTRLFERGHGKISLTPGGEVVLEYAERILSLTGELETRLKEMTGRLSGPLLIGASTTAAECMLPPILGEFKAQFPEVQARLHVANSGTIVAGLFCGWCWSYSIRLLNTVIIGKTTPMVPSSCNDMLDGLSR